MKARSPQVWFAAGGCLALLLAVGVALVGTGVWLYIRRPNPPVLPPAVQADTAAAVMAPRAILQSIALSIPEYSIMTPEQSEACVAVVVQLLAADEAGRLAPAEYAGFIDLWAAVLADNAVTDGEVAQLQRTAAAAAAD